MRYGWRTQACASSWDMRALLDDVAASSARGVRCRLTRRCAHCSLPGVSEQQAFGLLVAMGQSQEDAADAAAATGDDDASGDVGSSASTQANASSASTQPAHDFSDAPVLPHARPAHHHSQQQHQDPMPAAAAAAGAAWQVAGVTLASGARVHSLLPALVPLAGPGLMQDEAPGAHSHQADSNAHAPAAARNVAAPSRDANRRGGGPQPASNRLPVQGTGELRPQSAQAHGGGGGGDGEAEHGLSLSAEEMQMAVTVLAQLQPGWRAAGNEHPEQILQRLAAALTHQVFNASFAGNLRVLEAVFNLPQRLLAATGVNAGMQQAGSLLQPLHMASYNGHVSVVRFLLGQQGVSVNVAAGDHDSPLHKACYNAHSQVVSLLLEAGADANTVTPLTLEQQRCNHGHARGQTRNGRRTPMHYIVFNHELQPSDSRTECVRVLLNKGGDPNRADCWGLTPLHHAV
jgi:hypothetical protein